MDTINIDDTSVLDAVRETAMLADVSISVWQGTRTDKDLMEGVKAQHGARGNVGRVIKNLLAGADDPLRKAQGAYQAVRSRHYQLTLPWVSDPHAARATGPRLLPNALFNQYMTEMSALQREAKATLEELCTAYPRLVTEARANLGTMADANYPDVEDLRRAFHVSFDFEPLPEGARFSGLPEATLGKLAARLHKKQQNQITQATATMWREAKERVEHLVGRLEVAKDGEAPRFKAATVESVKALVTLLPGWNITNNPLAVEIAADIDKLMAGIDAKDLRDDTKVRAATASGARKIADKMKSWGV